MADENETDKDLKFELAKLEFEKSLQLRNFEIDNFWKRGWFFGALLTALLGGFFALKKDGHSDFAVCISFIAFFVSLFQALMNRGSKYWQERWEYVVKNKEAMLNINLTRARNPDLKVTEANGTTHFYERGMIDACIRAKNEGLLTRSARFSVSKLTFLIWDIITFTIFFLWLREFLQATVNIESYIYSRNIELVCFHLVIIGYIIVFTNINSELFEPLVKPETYINKNKQSKNKYYDLSEKYVDNRDLKTTSQFFDGSNSL